MTFNEIKELIDSDLFSDHDCGPAQWMWRDFPKVENCDEDTNPEFLEALKTLGEFDCVEEHGGEGQGDDYYAVFNFKDHNVFIQFQGWYASHHGSEYEEMFEVRPEEVMVIEYNRV